MNSKRVVNKKSDVPGVVKETENKIKVTKKVEVTIDIDKDVLFFLMLRAHEKDLTLNQFVEEVLKRGLKEMRKNNKAGGVGVRKLQTEK
jgi:hypothetical protein